MQPPSKPPPDLVNPTPKPPIPPQIQLVKATTLRHLERQGEFIGLLYIQPVNNPYDDETILASSVTTKLPPPKPEDIIPCEYRNFMDIFSEELVQKIPLHHDYDHRIKLEEGTTPPHGKLYNMSEMELKTLKD